MRGSLRPQVQAWGPARPRAGEHLARPARPHLPDTCWKAAGILASLGAGPWRRPKSQPCCGQLPEFTPAAGLGRSRWAAPRPAGLCAACLSSPRPPGRTGSSAPVSGRWRPHCPGRACTPLNCTVTSPSSPSRGAEPGQSSLADGQGAGACGSQGAGLATSRACELRGSGASSRSVWSSC